MNVHLAVILSLVPSFCLAQITFDAPIDLSTSVNGARGVYIEDMDGDGDNDILATGFIDDDLFWFENLNGTGTFSAKIQISPSGSLNGCWTASAGDMNGDGHMDAVAAAYSDDKAVWYAGDGAGNFGSENLIGDALDGVKDLAIADFDGDDDLDVVAACSVADDIIYMENMGNGTFGPKESLLSGIYWFDGAASVRPFDFDSDGDMDVVSASALSHVMGWHENDGLGNFSDFQYLTQEIFEPQCVDVGDVDKDGDYDLASAVLFADLIAFHYNPGNDDPWTDVDLNIDMTNAIFVRMGDLDRDGDLDVVGCGRFSDTFSWFENDGLGNFGPEILLTNANDNPEALAIGDLDGDLDKDIAIVSFQDDKVSWIKNNTPAPCLASDFDFSGNVDTADLLGFLTAFGCNYVCGWYDLDGNEEVNTQDILILLAQFGQGC